MKILYLFFIILLFSCNKRESLLELALLFAGENRSELEKVLEHYRNDPQKLAAACFIIENMPNCYSYNSWRVDSIKTILTDEITKDRTYGLGSIIIDDKHIKRWSNFSLDMLHKTYDAHIITADYLIENIELSFLVWKKYPWNKHLSFEDFCELILPYRVGHERLENWRKTYFEYYSSILDSLYSGSDVVEACDKLAYLINEEGFYLCTDFKLPNLGANYLMENRIGYCRDACDFILYVMRSVGIPTATDFYYYAPDSRLGHSWNVVRNTNGKFLQCGYTVFGTHTNARDDGRKKGKVYRECFGLQKNRVNNFAKETSIPELFKNPFIKDVTSDYFGKNKIQVSIENSKSKRAFLGVFTPEEWIPIDMAKAKNRNAIFHNLEPNLIYQTLTSEKSQLSPANYPFLYTGSDIKYFIPDTLQKENATLIRKYPIRYYTINSLNRNVRGSKIVGSQNLSFTNSELLYKITDSIIINRNIITFPKPAYYRYIRYITPDNKPLELAEFCIYNTSDIITPLPLEIIDSVTPIYDNDKFALKNIIDGDPLTFTVSQDSSCYVTFDLGKPTEIKKIMFIPRNDENFIHPGDTYELFYHDGINGWKSLGRKIAKTNELNYEIPKGALLWLNNLTRGKEEHFFYMENGKQIFALDI